MACNDPAWDRVISGLGLLVSAIYNEMFLTNDALLFQNNAMLKKCFYCQSDFKLRGGKVLAVSGKYQTSGIRYSSMPNIPAQRRGMVSGVSYNVFVFVFVFL